MRGGAERAAAVVTMALALALGSVAAKAQDLTGRWYGEGYQGRIYLHWITERMPGGFFAVEFRQYEECRLVREQKESGRWSFKDGLYSTVTTEINGKSVAFSDDYIVDSLEADVFRYHHREKGMSFVARRKPADFDWPACDPSRLTS